MAHLKHTPRPFSFSEMISVPWLLPTKLSPSSGQTGTSPAISPPPRVPGTLPAWNGLGPTCPAQGQPHRGSVQRQGRRPPALDCRSSGTWNGGLYSKGTTRRSVRITALSKHGQVPREESRGGNTFVGTQLPGAAVSGKGVSHCLYVTFWKCSQRNEIFKKQEI